MCVCLKRNELKNMLIQNWSLKDQTLQLFFLRLHLGTRINDLHFIIVEHQTVSCDLSDWWHQLNIRETSLAVSTSEPGKYPKHKVSKYAKTLDLLAKASLMSQTVSLEAWIFSHCLWRQNLPKLSLYITVTLLTVCQSLLKQFTLNQ